MQSWTYEIPQSPIFVQEDGQKYEYSHGRSQRRKRDDYFNVDTSIPREQLSVWDPNEEIHSDTYKREDPLVAVHVQANLRSSPYTPVAETEAHYALGEWLPTAFHTESWDMGSSSTASSSPSMNYPQQTESAEGTATGIGYEVPVLEPLDSYQDDDSAFAQQDFLVSSAYFCHRHNDLDVPLLPSLNWCRCGVVFQENGIAVGYLDADNRPFHDAMVYNHAVKSPYQIQSAEFVKAEWNPHSSLTPYVDPEQMQSEAPATTNYYNPISGHRQGV